MDQAVRLKVIIVPAETAFVDGPTARVVPPALAEVVRRHRLPHLRQVQPAVLPIAAGQPPDVYATELPAKLRGNIVLREVAYRDG